MNIIIAGIGSVGKTLAATLNEEGHDVTLIDENEQVLSEVSSMIDVLGIVGNATSYATLQEARIEQADLLIAVTGDDELNLLCCVMAKKDNACYTIARVRNPIYNSELHFLKDVFNISMIINPELEAASEISRLLRVPSALAIDSFAQGKAEIIEYKIKNNPELHTMRLEDFSKKITCEYLVVAIQRQEELIIPTGQTILNNGDCIYFITASNSVNQLFEALGVATKAVKKCMMIGGGTLSYYLADLLLKSGIAVIIIEKDLQRCEELSVLLPKAIIINGDATEETLLLEEGIKTTDAFVSLTELDEENIMLSLYANKVTDAKIVTKVDHSIFDGIIKDLDIGSVITLDEITTNQIISFVRSIQNTVGNNVEKLYKIVNNKVEALEFKVSEHAKCIKIPLVNLKLKEKILIGCINRGGKIVIPTGKDMILSGDTIVVITTEKGFNDIDDILY